MVAKSGGRKAGIEPWCNVATSMSNGEFADTAVARDMRLRHPKTSIQQRCGNRCP
jgi:hypothetical protein